MATLLWQRDLTSSLSDAKTTLSSWDNCMSKAYCKWPTIAGIILGSLIVLSLAICLVRCMCCGAECCCGCLSCLNCCNCGRRSKGYQQPPVQYQQPPYQQQYQSQLPPIYNNPPAQYAQFDASGTKGGHQIHEDSLPIMPSWDNAISRKVEDTTHPGELDDVEMEKLDQQGTQQAPMLSQTATQLQNSPYRTLSGAGGAEPEAMGMQNSYGYDADRPYQDYGHQQTGYTNPTYSQPTYPTPYGATTSTVYEPSMAYGQQSQAHYAASVAPHRA
ncbi:hypothetical protein LTR50_002711 [Elasticomyces elasticus]|nr:hypothetical protein LTR50_002711 [Elasticomyces elasticus]